MSALDMEMAAHVHERLARMDEAIELMQDLRKTAGTGSERESKDQFRKSQSGGAYCTRFRRHVSRRAELFQKDLFAFEEVV
jgi:hypothetical protein